jgi:trehalose synthase
LDVYRQVSEFAEQDPLILSTPTEERAHAMLKLLNDPELRGQLRQSRREHVREHFLLPRLLMEEHRLLRALDAR